MGVVKCPPDKSIAHRAAILSAIGDGPSRIVNFPQSADPQSTLSVLRQLGVAMYEEDDVLVIEGRGPRGFSKPSDSLDCGNSGTTLRLMAGLLAGQSFSSTLTGDASLRSRPMRRITEPLARMGASIDCSNGCAPLSIRGGRKLSGIEYRLPVASAQVKSCVLLAGLVASGTTTVIESSPSRDHTERMLGLNVLELGEDRMISTQEGLTVEAAVRSVPGDFSASSFFLVAGSIIPGSRLRIPRVGLNPTRSGLLDVLTAMGAKIRVGNERMVAGEPIGDLSVQSSSLSGIQLEGDIIPNVIDEIPIFAVAAAASSGTSIVTGAGELRHKETDRIDAMVDGLSAMGVDISGTNDGFRISGGDLHGGTVDSCGDHRVAMALAIAALAANGPTHLRDPGCVAVSFPEFWSVLNEISDQ